MASSRRRQQTMDIEPVPSTSRDLEQNYSDSDASSHMSTDNVVNTDDELFVTDSDDDIDADVSPPVWSIHTSGLKHIEFRREEKFLIPLPGQGRPIDFFNVMLDDIVLDNIAKFTNRNAIQVFLNSATLTPKSRITKWKDVTVPELKIFFALMIHTGTYKLNRLNDYWKTHWLFTEGQRTVFARYMSRDRFLCILRCLNFEDKNVNFANERIAKIQFFVDYFNSKMEYVFYPQRELSLDESMVLWRGRLIFRQYLKGKKHKYGIKLYTLSDPHGLILRFMIYCGVLDDLGGKGHAANVVLKLMERKLGVGHSLFMDNYYNSFMLASKLLSKDTYCTGTLRIDRKHSPVDVKTAVLKKGETIARYSEGVCIGKWKDKRVVHYISTEYENEMVQFINNRDQIREKPLPIVKYNGFMKGVDRGDMMLAYYPIERKTLRWYKKLGIHILHMILLNSHTLHNIHIFNAGSRRIPFYDFRMSVLECLLPKPAEPVPFLPLRGTDHTLSVLGPRPGKPNAAKKKDCRICTKNGKRKTSKYFCEACPGQPGLCPGPCFDTFHKK